MKDRRGSGRFPFVAAVRQEVAASAGAGLAGLHLGQSANLGLLGMQVRRRSSAVEPALPMRTRVQLAFELPDGGQLLQLDAEVVFDRSHARDGGHRMTGLRFAALPVGVAERLRACLGEEEEEDLQQREV